MEEDMDDFETVVKVIVIGEGRVGKSSMTQRYCRGVYTDTYKKTIGVDFLEKQIELEDIGEEVKLMIWDTAGQEEFDSLTKGYYRGAGAVVLVFSTVDRDSFERIPRWLEKAKTECGMVPMALVQNKCDLEDSAAVSKSEVAEMAQRYDLKLFRTSVKDNVNVAEVFEYLTAEYIELQDKGELGEPAVDVIGQHNHAVVDHDNTSPTKVEEQEAKSPPKTPRSSERKHQETQDSPPRDVSPEKAERLEDKEDDSKTREKQSSADQKTQRQPINRRQQDLDENIKKTLPPPKPEDRKGAFKLTPSKQRTRGKKSKPFCSIL